MANPGTFQTYDLNVGIKLDIEDAIWLISPFDVPLQGAQGSDGRTALSTGTCFETKVEWLDEVLLTPKSTLAAYLPFATTTNLGLATGTGINFQTGDALLLSSATNGTETVIVTGYSVTTADTLVITRGAQGSSATTFATSDTVLGVGSAAAEGGDPSAARAVDRTDRYNYTQIFGPTMVQVSGTEQVVQKYGLVGTEFDHQIANRIKELSIAFEQALINGTRYAGSATVGRGMGGLTYWISTNVDSTTTALTDSTFLAQLQTCFDAGGQPDRFVVGSKQKRNTSGLNSANIRYVQETNRRGQVVDSYESDFGIVDVILDRWCSPAQGFLFSRDQASIETLRPLTMEMLAKTGDSVKGQVVAERTLKFRRQTHAARFSALQ